MARQLLKTTEVYRMDTEEEAIGAIEECKDKATAGGYIVTKSGYALKTKKSKGEIVDMWTVVTLEKTFE